MKTKVYFAGKIDRMDWRHDILPFLEDVDYPVLEKVARDSPCLQEIPIKGTPFIYTGPYFISEGGHGLYHGENTHGAMSECDDESTFPIMVTSCCLHQIRNADFIFCWMDSLDAYGTLYELGFAHALGKHIIIATQDAARYKDMWFAFTAAEPYIIEAESALKAWEQVVQSKRMALSVFKKI